jgi:broad specificity phosphatase PhoE
MAALKIMLVRHAEKPGVPPPPAGVDEDGSPDPESLTDRGWQRARALVAFFDPADGQFRDGIAKPSHLFATKAGADHSRRPIDTLVPLRDHLGVEIDETYKSSDIKELTDAAKRCDGVVLIAWKHEDIPDIARGISNDRAIPAHWPGERFDVVWVFDLIGGGYAFGQAAEELLPGDSAAAIEA